MKPFLAALAVAAGLAAGAGLVLHRVAERPAAEAFATAGGRLAPAEAAGGG